MRRFRDQVRDGRTNERTALIRWAWARGTSDCGPMGVFFIESHF